MNITFDKPDYMIPILEIFKSLEGECQDIGTPTIFVRTAGCDLQCPYCDTKESWDIKEEQYATVRDVAEIIKTKLINPSIRRVSFTGGNPMLHFDQLVNIVSILKNEVKEDLTYNLEHPGIGLNKTVELFDGFAKNYLLSTFNTVVMDVKLFFAQDRLDKYVMLDNVFNTVREFPNIIPKVMISNKEDLELLSLFIDRNPLPTRIKYLSMIRTGNAEELKALTKEVVTWLCHRSYGDFKLSYPQHIALSYE